MHQEWSVFAPCALSKAEQNYAQIEKECLSVLFACERLDQYLLGRECTLFTQTTSLWSQLSASHCLMHQRHSNECCWDYRNTTWKWSTYLAARCSLLTCSAEHTWRRPQQAQFQSIRYSNWIFKDIKAINQMKYLQVSNTTHQQIKKTRHSKP